MEPSPPRIRTKHPKGFGVSIYCDICNGKIDARLTNGAEIYPHRPDLADLPFWKCDTCGGYVGCHHRSAQPTKPLGIIVDKETKQLRIQVHDKFDKQWKGYKAKSIVRGSCYKWLAGLMKMSRNDCHIGNFTKEQCHEALEQMALHPYHDYIMAKRAKRKKLAPLQSS